MDILLDGNKASFQDSVATYPACYHVLTCRFLEKSLSWPGFAPQPPCQSSTNQACFYMENGIVHAVKSLLKTRYRSYTLEARMVISSYEYSAGHAVPTSIIKNRANFYLLNHSRKARSAVYFRSFSILCSRREMSCCSMLS